MQISQPQQPLLVSVIVPVYNVEQYVCHCIESILSQTYKHIEVIIIDDGSTDSSASICKDFASVNELVFFFEQPNGGLSKARNVGLSKAHGEYVTFVDSDDWLAPEMIEKCMHCIIEQEADACGVSFMKAYANHFVANETIVNELQIYTNEQALSKYLFNTNLTVCVCGKVWKTSLWDSVRCPTGKLHEDQFTTYRLIEAASKILFLPEPLYYYRQREGSIGHSSFSERSYDLEQGVVEQHSYISKKYPICRKDIAAACSFWFAVFVNMMIRSDYWDDAAARNCQRFVRLHCRDVVSSDDLPLTRKAQLMLFALSLTLYKFIYLRYFSIHSRDE